MQAVMAKTRIRLTLDINDAHKRAFHSAASIAGLSPQELFEKWVEENAPEELERAQKAIDTEQKKPKK